MLGKVAKQEMDLDDVGKKLKLSGKIDVSQLRAWNYDKSEDDSIDISDILRGDPEYFDPITMLHYKMPNNANRMRARNYQEEQTDYQYSQESGQIRHKQILEATKIQAEEEKLQFLTQAQGQGQQKSGLQKSEKVADEEEVEQKEEKREMKEQVQEHIQAPTIKQIKQQAGIQQREDEPTSSEHTHKQLSQLDSDPDRFLSEAQRRRARRLRRCRSNRKQSFPKDVLESIMGDFKRITPENIREIIASMSERFSLGVNLLMRMFKEWQSDPKMAKYTNSVEQPLGALIDGKRERTLTRIKHIEEMIDINPYLTQKEISDKLFEIDKSKKRVLRSAIIRLLKIAGYRKIRIQSQTNQQTRALILRQRKDYVEKYRQLQEKKAQFYYLGQCLLHKYIGCDSFWTKQKKAVPHHSKRFIAQSMLLVAFLTPAGNLYWEIRGGDYHKDEYSDLITRMLKKMNAKKVHSNCLNAVVISESTLRSFELNKALVERGEGVAIRFPKKSWQMNPLEALFEQLKEKSKKIMLGSQQQAIKNFSELARNFKKPELLSLISKSQNALRKIEKGQTF